MSGQGEKAERSFRIEVDDALLQDALEAVERRAVSTRHAADPDELDLDLGLDGELPPTPDEAPEASPSGEEARSPAGERPGAAEPPAPAPGHEEIEPLQEALREAEDRARLEEIRRLRLAGDVATLRVEREELRSSARRLEALNAELKEALRAQLAERDAARERQRRLDAELRAFALEGLFRSLLPALDHLDLALSPEHESSDAAALAEGLRMTATHLRSTLERAGLGDIRPGPGERFDPKRHQAIERVEHPEIPVDHVVRLCQPGYMLHSRVLRAARVAVSVGDGSDLGQPPRLGLDGAEE